MNMDESSSALEQFRQQWKAEVDARSKQKQRLPYQSDGKPRVRRPSEPKQERPLKKPPGGHPTAEIRDDSDHDASTSRRDGGAPTLVQKIEGLSIKVVDDDDFSVQGSTVEPKTALEHYEKAVERESQGNLGDSVALYRRAYKLDAKVDQAYKNKHFPAKSKTESVNPSNGASTVPSTAHHSSKDPVRYSTTAELIQSFAGLPILGVPPVIPGDRPPVCPITKLPTEVLIELLRHIALQDPAILARLASVCKKLAYHISTENLIWRRLALGPEFGFASQRYTFATDLQGREAVFKSLEYDAEALPQINEISFPQDTLWREIFHSHPRIRFSGIYISTVNYTRPGGASATQHVWYNPIHIVTYYRYLRFFRDGTCISLLTTNEPLEVVHHLTRENLNLVRSKGKDGSHPLNFTSSAAALVPPPQPNKDGTYPPAPPLSAQQLMKHALRGRWRLCHPALDSEPTSTHENAPTMVPGDLHIETEGAGPRYMYTMHLTLKSASRSKTGVKNNKLQWKGFWSYNILTNDWSEFQLRHDKPFFFSRVKSYGLQS